MCKIISLKKDKPVTHSAFNLRGSCVVPFRGFIIEFHGRKIGIYSAWCWHTHSTAIIQIGATMQNRIILWKHDYLVYHSCMMGIPCNTNTSMQHNYAAKMFERMLLIFRVFADFFRFRIIVYHEAKGISFTEEMIKMDKLCSFLLSYYQVADFYAYFLYFI